MAHGDADASLKRIDELLNEEAINTESTHHLTLMRGDVMVEQGDLSGAEAAYETVRQAAAPSDGNNEALFRQASLRLARLYAKTGDEENEQKIARELKQAFAAR